MSKEIEWIKQAVNICISGEMVESIELQKQFASLELIYKEFSTEEKMSVRNILKTQFENSDLIYILSYFVQYMGLEEFHKDIFDCIFAEEMDCYTGSMLELQCINKKIGTYTDRRRLHKKNVEAYKKLLAIEHPYRNVIERKKNRIFISTEQILSEKHAPTRIVLNYAYILQKMGYEVLILVCPIDAQSAIQGKYWHHSIYMNSIPELRNKPMRLEFKGEVLKGYQINMTEYSEKKYSTMISMIYEWNPLFVWNMGVLNPVADVINSFTTVVSMGMTIDCPLSEGEILLRIARKDDASEEEYIQALTDSQKQLFIEKKAPTILCESKKEYSRVEYNLPEDKFLIAIVGNRLDSEVDEEFIDVMQNIMSNEEMVDFVIIGPIKELNKKFEIRGLSDRVHYLGYCYDLQGVYSVLDLYLNPKRVGGGYSSAMALAENLPVVTLPECDVAYNCGEAFVVKDYEDMVATVQMYIEDEAFRESKKACAKKITEQNSEEAIEDYVKTIVEQVKELMMK